MIRQTCIKNKKGISMVELLGYIVLMGSVFTLLSSTTLLIGRSSQKAYEKNRLNVATTQLYGDLLTIVNRLQPDKVVVKDAEGSNPKMITFEKTFKFDDEGNQVAIANGDLNKFIYSFNSTSKGIKLESYILGNTIANTSNDISMNGGIVVESFDFQIASESSGVKNIEFKGILSNNTATREFLFTIPIYTT